MKCLSNLLSKIDFFGVKQSFRIKDKEKYGTAFGGFCFILYGIAATLFLLYSLKVFIGKETFTVMVIDKAITPAKRLNLTEQEFHFSMRVTFENGSSLVGTKYHDLFDLQAHVVRKLVNKTDKINIPMAPCNKKDYYHLSNSSLFERIPMNDFICFGNKHQHVIEGSRIDAVYATFDFTVNVNPKYIKDYASLTNIFKENLFKLNMYYSNPMHDISNKDHPVSYQMNDFYTYLDLNVFKSNDIAFQEFVFSDDSNLLLDHYKSENHMRLKSFNYHAVSILDRQNSNLEKKYSLVKYKLRADNVQHIVKRSYKKITDFLAGLMALLINCLIGLGFVIKMVNNLKARQCIIKRVMKYNDYLGENQQTQEVLKTIQSNFDNKGDKPVPAQKEITISTRQEDLHDRDDVNAGLMGDKAENEEHPKPKNKFTVTACDFFLILICCKKRKKKEIYLNAEKKIFYNIDILTYMKKMQELEIIKYMLLDEKTVKLLNFIAKPGVSYINRGSSDASKPNPFFYNGEDFKVEPDYLSELENIKLTYKEMKANPNLSKGETKMIELFESQVNDIITPKDNNEVDDD